VIFSKSFCLSGALGDIPAIGPGVVAAKPVKSSAF
jgi:hypothetical protein